MAADDREVSTKNPKADNNNSAEQEDVVNRLPDQLKQILDKEQNLLEIDRSQARDLLAKGIKTEKKFLEEWGRPSAWSFEGCSEEAQYKATCWFELTQKQLEKDKEELTNKVAEAQTNIDQNLDEIENVEQNLKTLLDNLEALPKEDREFLYLRVNQRVWDGDQRSAYFSTLRKMASYVIKLQRDLENRLAEMQVPTLILWGEDDKIITPENGRILDSIQQNTRLEIIPGAGHVPQQETPGAVVDAILSDNRFLR